jgi:hypothetical protein
MLPKSSRRPSYLPRLMSPPLLDPRLPTARALVPTSSRTSSRCATRRIITCIGGRKTYRSFAAVTLKASSTGAIRSRLASSPWSRPPAPGSWLRTRRTVPRLHRTRLRRPNIPLHGVLCKSLT